MVLQECAEAAVLVPVLAPVAALILIVVATLAALRLANRRSTNDKARNAGLFLNFVAILGFALIVPDAADLSFALGRDATASGFLVGFFMASSAVGSMCVFAIVVRRPAALLDLSRRLLLLASTAAIAGASLYFVVASRTPRRARETGLATAAVVELEQLQLLISRRRRWVYLIASRALLGFGHGIGAYTIDLSFTRLTKVAERPRQSLRFYLAVTLGIGCGPLVSALAHMLETATSEMLACGGGGETKSSGRLDATAFVSVAALQVVLSISAFIAVVCVFPHMSDAVDYQRDDEDEDEDDHAMVVKVEQCEEDGERSDDAEPREEPTERDGVAVVRDSVHGCGANVAVIVGGLLCVAIRSFCVSSLEVGSALLLEVKYGWSTTRIGVAIGFVFLNIIPAKGCHSLFGSRFKLVTWVRTFAFVAIPASLLLTSRACDVFSVALLHGGGNTADDRTCAALLLIGDALIFPAIYLSNSLSNGLMMQHVLPDGALFDATKVTLMNKVIGNGVGRFLGPWLARAQIQHAGQNSYGLQQLFLAISFFITFETLMVQGSKCLFARR